MVPKFHLKFVILLYLLLLLIVLGLFLRNILRAGLCQLIFFLVLGWGKFRGRQLGDGMGGGRNGHFWGAPIFGQKP